MPRGGKPKAYPADMVARVASLYGDGHTQVEIAAVLHTTQKVIWRLMRRHGLPTRPQIKRDQRGEKNSMWKGSGAGYKAMHLRVASMRGKPQHCEQCGRVGSGTYDWATTSRRYDDVNQYLRLCRSCHWKLDGTVRNLQSKEVCHA